MTGGLLPIRNHPFSDRVVRLIHAVVWAAVDGNGSLTSGRFSRVHLARSFKCAPNLDTEVAQYGRARLRRVVIEKNVVASVRRLGWLRMNSRPIPAPAPTPEPTAPGATSRRTAANLRG